jgi:hypothetical protein
LCIRGVREKVDDRRKLTISFCSGTLHVYPHKLKLNSEALAWRRFACGNCESHEN